MSPLPALTLRAALTLALAAGALAASPAAAQPYALRVDVASGGATDASGGAYRLRGTVGQPVAGRVAGGAYALGQGFWYPATNLGGGGSPALSVTATPLNPPITVPAGGGEFRFRVTITNNTAQAQTFDAWITATLPNGADYHVLGPQSLTLGPNQTFGPVTLRQQIPASAPAGAYAHNVRVGTFPSGAVATGSFPWTKLPMALLADGDALTLGAHARPAGARRDSRQAAREGAAREGTSARPVAPEATGRAVPSTPSGRAALRAGWLLLMDATGEPVGGGGDLVLAMPIDEAAEARITAEEEAGAAAEEYREAGLQRTSLPRGAGVSAAEVPVEVVLLPPFPNPSRERAALRFALPEGGAVRLAVYDVAGRRVAVLLEGACAAGWHEAALDASALAAGVYVARLEAGGRVLTRRLSLVR